MSDLLQARAGQVVLGGWLLVVLIVGLALTVGVSSAISSFYHPLHRLAPFARFNVQTLWFAVIASAVAAVAASIALRLSFRTSASAIILLTWAAILVAASIARLFVKAGPEVFERYVGEHRFLVPWQFAPYGVDYPGPYGLSITACIETLRGTYDKTCRDGRQVTIRSRERGFSGVFDESIWRSSLPQMRQEDDRGGHQAYAYDKTDAQGRTKTDHFFARYDSEGKLRRLVRCYDFDLCNHHAITADYLLSYSTKKSAFADWEQTDQRLVGLVDSWRADRARSHN
jgi:hypothetical protein